VQCELFRPSRGHRDHGLAIKKSGCASGVHRDHQVFIVNYRGHRGYIVIIGLPSGLHRGHRVFIVGMGLPLGNY
jgi:hypothetical protein